MGEPDMQIQDYWQEKRERYEALRGAAGGGWFEVPPEVSGSGTDTYERYVPGGLGIRLQHHKYCACVDESSTCHPYWSAQVSLGGSHWISLTPERVATPEELMKQVFSGLMRLVPSQGFLELVAPAWGCTLLPYTGLNKVTTGEM